MKLLNLKGQIVNVDVRQSTYPLRDVSKSKLQKLTQLRLLFLYPNATILEEFTVPNERLFLDFYIPLKKLAVEVQSIIHEKPVLHFHKSMDGFGKQIKRDRRKAEFCEINGIKLIEIWTEEDLEKLNGC